MSESDIEDLHKAACAAGESKYKDPSTGYTVMTSFYHKKRGYCCGHRCRHCPFGHFNVDGKPQVNRLVDPTLLIPSQKGKVAEELFQGKALDILFWSGGKDSFLTYLTYKKKMQTSDRQLVLLTTYTNSTGMIAHQNVDHRDVMKQFKYLREPAILIPLPDNNSIEEYLLINDAIPKVTGVDASQIRCIFGDLHLKDIQSWRIKNMRYPCLFPVFDAEYSLLQSYLFTVIEKDGVKIQVSGSSHPAVVEGTVFNKEFISTLPQEVDTMGENGEFHTLVQFPEESVEAPFAATFAMMS